MTCRYLVDPVDDAFHFNHWGEVRSRKINKLQAPVLDYLIYSRYPLLEQLINSCEKLIILSQIRIFNYNTLERQHAYEAHSDYVRSIAVHPTQVLS